MKLFNHCAISFVRSFTMHVMLCYVMYYYHYHYDPLYSDGKLVRMYWGDEEDGVKFMIWNCNGLSTDKTEIVDFTNKLLQDDVNVLLESWTWWTLRVWHACLHNIYNFFRKFRNINLDQEKQRRYSFVYKGWLKKMEYQLLRTILILSFGWTLITYFSIWKMMYSYVRAVFMWSDEPRAARVYGIDLFNVLEKWYIKFTDNLSKMQ